MENMWNQRFAGEEFVYGSEPNLYFKKMLEGIKPGNMLLPAEGEGRNAVYAAKLGWNVYAYDSSNVGKEKALAFAKQNGVTINYLVASHEEVSFECGRFDLVAFIYSHMSSEIRHAVHQKLLMALKPGGVIILEGFSTEQLQYSSGGPKDVDLLYSEQILQTDFAYLKSKEISREIVVLNEGEHHKGEASVIRMFGVK